MARPKGSPNRRSQMLLKKLENDHNFCVVKELIEMYNLGKEVVVYLADRMHENIQNELPPTTGFTEEEVDMYNGNYKNTINILVRILSYCYPKLKAMEINQGSTDKIVFNISGMPDAQQSYSPPPQQEETVH